MILEHRISEHIVFYTKILYGKSQKHAHEQL